MAGSGAAMALNLSKNGRALQEAYGRVVAAGSPTDWWAWGGGSRGSGGGWGGRRWGVGG